MQSALVALVLAQMALLDPAGRSAVPEHDDTRCEATDRTAEHRVAAPYARHALSTCAERGAPSRRGWQDSPRDEWFAVDKVQHFAMAYGTAMFGYGVLRGAGMSHADATAAALAGSLAAGIGKEVFDRSRGGMFSLKDLTWDALGTLAAWSLLSLNR